MNATILLQQKNAPGIRGALLNKENLNHFTKLNVSCEIFLPLTLRTAW